MNNFIFHNPTKLIFGKGTIARLATEIPADARVLITMGSGSIKTNGVYDQVKTALKNHHTSEFWGIEPNPKYETLLKAIEQARAEKIDYLLAVGGGSVLDGTKLIASAIPYSGQAWDLVLDSSLIKQSIKIAAVMTLPATGSEMNAGAVISRISTQEKLAFKCPLNYPQFSILDPETTYSLPLFQLSCGLTDTFVHTIEQYLTTTHNHNLLIDRWSEGLLKTLIEIAPAVMATPADYDARANYMLSATMALNDIIGIGAVQDWATHMIGHELTALEGLTHGVALAIVLPALLRTMRTQKEDKLLQYSERVWGITSGSVDERIEAAIVATEEFFQSLNIPTHLTDYGIGDKTIAAITQRWAARGWALGEKGNVDAVLVGKILEAAR